MDSSTDLGGSGVGSRQLQGNLNEGAVDSPSQPPRRFGSSPRPAGVGYEWKAGPKMRGQKETQRLQSSAGRSPGPPGETGTAVWGRLCSGGGGGGVAGWSQLHRAPRSGPRAEHLHRQHTKAGSAPATTWPGALSRIPAAPHLGGSPGSKDIRPNLKTADSQDMFHDRGSKVNKRKKLEIIFSNSYVQEKLHLKYIQSCFS